MSHLHIPDGVLPWHVWGVAWIAAIGVLLLAGMLERNATPRDIALRGSIGALVLAAMTLTIPVGPLEYHLSLLGPVGVLLGVTASFEVLFIVASILAFAGHGGFTVIGLNALLLGTGAAIARPVFRLAAPRAGAAAGLAIAAAVSQAVAGALWAAVMLLALRDAPAGRAVLGWAGGVAAALWAGGVVVETLVALAVGRFLARVKPELLPGAWTVAPAVGSTKG